ncbi:MAG: GH92 family glycosyl hydrolase [Acidobacteria bacterium]|nr:GH92 family glycosyl hydrolase [Acidobacteriota bacterium]MCA1641662.1 GH92 family glycosyl hydrolase [Acidobacteriota bacterium]
MNRRSSLSRITASALLAVSMLLVWCAPALGQAARRARTLASYADPFVGTENGGNVVPGAQVPFGFVHASPDTANHNTAGYNPYENVLGFSQTHVSGTGGASKYGNFLTTPAVGALRVANLGSPKAEETASPGYYSVRLTRPDVKAELTATRLVAFHRYTFPASKLSHLLVEASSVVQPERGEDAIKNPHAVDCWVRVISPNRVEGSGNFVGGWNQSPYTVHFSAEFDRPFATYGTWRGGRVEPGTAAAGSEGRVGAYATFDTTTDRTVQMKIGVSFVSPERARANLAREVPGWDFDAVRRAAEAEWESVLGKIKVEGGTEEQREIFYTALYHSHYMPHDLTGENAWWVSSEPHYEDFYAIWDTFRTHFPLLTLIQPDRHRDMVRSLVDTYAHTGWMPDSRIAGANGMTQGGSNGDVVVADALAKGVTGIDYAKAYEALVKNAEVDSPRPLYEGRALADYKRLGYVSMNYPRSASRTMEYAYDDFCVAQVARALGHTADAEKYLARSKNWANVWSDEARSARPRRGDGTWLAPFAASHFYPDRDFSYWDAPFYEGSGYIYGTYVPHDAQGLINKLGGDDQFVAWLDAFFANPPTRDPAFNPGLYNHNNEPDFLAAFLYVHAGRPDRTQERVRRILATEYKTGRGGLPGNDDSGAMSSWYVWGALGLYPNAGQPFYYVGSPVFRRASVDLGGGRTFTVEAPEVSETNLYVQSATLDGRALDRAWLRHEEIARGGRLVLRMGAKPSPWGRGERPPSLSPPAKTITK